VFRAERRLSAGSRDPRQAAALSALPAQLTPAAGGAATDRRSSPAASDRLRTALAQHFELVWRTLRRFGVDEANADDAAQHVFLTFSDRLSDVLLGAERSFLVGTCVRVAANFRRLRQRRAEVSEPGDFTDVEGQTPEQLLEWKQLRRQLDVVLEALSAEQRTVFVLHELEGFSLPEIAESLGIPLGTATSRLRRARLAFEARVSAEGDEGAQR
jgi:RNA polymerase sigma-70 factor (ECF subfamily)